MKQPVQILLFLLLLVSGTNALACEAPPCYSLALASLVPGDVNANSVLDTNDQYHFVLATDPVNEPTKFLTCLQIAGMDIDTNGKLDSADLGLFDYAFYNSAPLPNSNSSWGDVDESGMVDQQDVLRYFDNSALPAWGDVDGDSDMDSEDARILKDCLSNQIDKLPVIE